MEKRYDVVIGGGGIAGLSLAALLSSRGDLRVLLVEREDSIGGRFRIERRDGYLVDRGVHACLLGSRGAIAKVLSRSGKRVRFLPAGAAIWTGGHLAPFLGDGLSSIIGQKVVPISDMLRLCVEVLRPRGQDFFETTLLDWAESRGASGRLTGLLESLCAGLMPTGRFDKASSGEILAFLHMAFRKWRAMGYPEGGWGSVLAALEDAIHRSPLGELATGVSLQRILTAGGRVVAVLVDGQEIETSSVVCAFPPQEFAREGMVEPGLEPGYRGRLAALEPGWGVSLDIGLEVPVTPERRLILSPDPPALLWAVSNVSPAVAPNGRQLLQLFSPMEGSEAKDEELVKERCGMLVDLAGKVFGGRLEEEWRRVMATRIVSVVPYTTQSLPSRPGIEVPGVGGLFLIGDGVMAAGLGGDLAARSALAAEAPVLNHLGKR